MASTNLADLVRSAKPGSTDEIPVGEYAAVVSNAEFSYAKSGSPMYKAEFTVQDEPHVGRKAFRYIAITERSIGMALDNLLALGTTQEAVADSIGEDNPQTEAARALVCQHLIDTPCRIRIDHQKGGEYAGRAEVKKIMPASAAQVNPLAATAAVPGARPASPF